MNLQVHLPETQYLEHHESLVQTTRVGIGVANGTFGELLQGALPGKDNYFLVTFPVVCYSRALFFPNPFTSDIEITPAHKTKSLKLAAQILEHYKVPCGGHIMIESDLPEGKGLASSTADLVAVARALSMSFGRELDPSLLMRFLKNIEPSDGIMFPDFVSFYHRKVKLFRRLGYLPTLLVIAIDEGGQVDTLEYNQVSAEFSSAEKREYETLLEELTQAFKHHDVEKLGEVTTRSAILNQKRNPKRFLDRVIQINEEVGSLGVVIAHSGTCLGVTLSTQDPQFENKRKAALERLGTLSHRIIHLKSIDFNQPSSVRMPADVLGGFVPDQKE